MNEEQCSERPEICISIDVERDYRNDKRLTFRGIEEGLPMFLDKLRSLGLPHDLFVSGEVVDRLPRSVVVNGQGLRALGCHGLTHELGPASYLSRKARAVLESELRVATDLVEREFGQRPIHFRAPNFSTSGDTISVLETLGYRSDSSILPGRFVRRWKVVPLLDHRGANVGPYHPDRVSPIRKGDSSILEVPVTPNPLFEGSPLGLGFLHESGPETVLRTVKHVRAPYVIFLCHSWEMVSWGSDDPVAPWVRRAALRDTRPLEELISALDDFEIVNMDAIYARETRRDERDVAGASGS